ncbi:MAG: hypothetical protein ACRC1N_14565 [Aeromonas sobria]
MFLHRKTVERSIKNISLDIDNPRLIGYKRRGAFKTQNEIIKVLAESYDVIDICNSILKNGFHPDEILITIPKGDSGRSSIVVEGNRRLCACKILINPDLLKGSSVYLSAKRLKSHENYAMIVSSIARVNVVELPGRREAASYLASKHTQEPIKRWGVYTQGAYYMGLKSAEMKLAELKSTLNDQVPLQRIKQVVLFYQLSEYILDMECWSVEEQSYLVSNIDRLKIEAIVRLINSLEFKDNVGTIRIDEKGNLRSSGFSKDSFSRVMEKLARDAHFNEKDDGSNVITTRQENKEEITAYIEDVADIKQSSINEDEDEDEDEDMLLSGTDEEADTGEAENHQEPEQKVGGRASNKRKWTRLVSEGTPSPISMAKLADLVDEAKKLNVKNYKYSSVLLARAIIEITLKLVIKNKGLESELKATYRDRSGDFENILKFSETKIRDLSDDPSVQKAVRSSIQSLLTRDKEIMNLTNHNEIQILSDKDALHIKGIVQTIADSCFGLLVADNL